MSPNPRRAAELATITLYAALLISSLGAFLLWAASFRHMGAARWLSYSVVTFLIAGAVWKRCEAIWEGRAGRLWLDAAVAAAFWALLAAGARGFGSY